MQQETRVSTTASSHGILQRQCRDVPPHSQHLRRDRFRESPALHVRERNVLLQKNPTSHRKPREAFIADCLYDLVIGRIMPTARPAVCPPAGSAKFRRTLPAKPAAAPLSAKLLWFLQLETKEFSDIDGVGKLGNFCNNESNPRKIRGTGTIRLAQGQWKPIVGPTFRPQNAVNILNNVNPSV
jgi:hypothetical protein